MTPESIIALLEAYRYWILFPLACIEGPIVSLATGFLISTNYFRFWWALAVIVPGDVLPDLLYYCIGRFAGNSGFAVRNRHKIGLTPERLQRIESLWSVHAVKLMMISKWAYGLSTPLLITAGMSRVNISVFVLLSTVLSVLQYSILLFLGWKFGESIQSISRSFEAVSIIATVALGLSIVAYGIFSRYMRSTFLRD